MKQSNHIISPEVLGKRIIALADFRVKPQNAQIFTLFKTKIFVQPEIAYFAYQTNVQPFSYRYSAIVRLLNVLYRITDVER